MRKPASRREMEFAGAAHSIVIGADLGCASDEEDLVDLFREFVAENDARWGERIKLLEGRLHQIRTIAEGRR